MAAIRFRAKTVVRSEIPAEIERPTIVRTTFREVVILSWRNHAEDAGNTGAEREGTLSTRGVRHSGAGCRIGANQGASVRHLSQRRICQRRFTAGDPVP